MAEEKKKISIVRSRGYEFSIVTVEKRNDDNVEGLIGTTIESKIYLIESNHPTQYEHRAISDRIPLRTEIRPANEFSNYYLLLNKSLRMDVAKNMKNNPQKYLRNIEKVVSEHDQERKYV